MKNPRGRPRNDWAASENKRTMLDRAIDVLEAVSALGPISLTDLIDPVQLPASTVHRLLLLLEDRQYVSMDASTQKWEVGVRAFQVGNSYLRRTSLAEVARAHLTDIGSKTGETVNLAIRHGLEMVVIAQVESHNPIRAFFRLGSHSPAHASAGGKAILANLSRFELERLFHRGHLAGLTEATITSPEALFSHLGAVKSQGWALDDEEQVNGMRCVAAPIFDKSGAAVASLSVTGPTARFDKAAIEQYAKLVKQAAEKLTATLRGE